LAFVLGVIAVVTVTFRHVLIPFILALIIVYLMEPIVKRLAKGHLRGWLIPRWLAVIMVYIVFAGSITAFALAVVPPLSREVSSLAEEAPRFLDDARNEYIPELNQHLQGWLDRIFPVVMTEYHVNAAKDDLHAAYDRADSLATLVGALPPEARELYYQGGLTVEIEGEGADEEEPAALRIRTDPESGDWLVLLEAVELVRTSEQEQTYLLRMPTAGEEDTQSSAPHLDLEASMNEALTEFVEVSGQGIAGIVTLGQDLIVALLSAFFGMMLTFMIAAFISIDLPSIVAYFRGLVPPGSRASFDDLLRRLDRGLSGVVRGQLMICLVNGVLTLIGLLIFDVKFAFLLATLASLLSLIPIFGTIISTIPIVGMALPNGIMTGVLVLGWILMIHFIEANLLNPKIIGTSAKIHPVIVIFALLAGEHSFGLIGALLAVPVASVCLTLLKWMLDRWAASHETAEEATV